MRRFVIFLLSVFPPNCSKVTWDTLYNQKYLTTVPQIGIFRDVTLYECSQKCRKYVEKCNVAIYDGVTVSIPNVCIAILFETITE